MPIDLLLHTPGGLVLAAEQIAMAICRHKAKVTVFVPHHAMSGGTLIAMAADEIVMDENAVLGPVDPQLGQWPAASILQVVEHKKIDEVDDQTLIMADIARKAQGQIRRSVIEILTSNGMPSEKAETLAQTLSSGVWTHDYPITMSEARPSVQYIPLPYPQPPRNDGRRPAA